LQAYKAGELQRDFVAVVRFQGPRANGMPELHKLTPPLANLQDAGFKVALVTDGRMSGASGKVPAAIHAHPQELGFTLLKLFPAQQAGGIGMLKAMGSVFPDAAFCPTGGISRDNAGEFLALPNVMCVGGSWVAPPAMMKAGDWAGIRALAQDAARLAKPA
jgi:hypothetical protein